MAKISRCILQVSKSVMRVAISPIKEHSRLFPPNPLQCLNSFKISYFFLTNFFILKIIHFQIFCFPGSTKQGKTSILLSPLTQTGRSPGNKYNSIYSKCNLILLLCCLLLKSNSLQNSTKSIARYITFEHSIT